MSEYLVRLRYYPGDSWEEINEDDLQTFAKEYGVNIAYEKIENREMKDGLRMEKTIDKRIEDISQEVITLSAEKEDTFSGCIKALYKKYRCPRTPYSLLGSNDAGQKIAKRLMDIHGGW